MSSNARNLHATLKKVSVLPDFLDLLGMFVIYSNAHLPILTTPLTQNKPRREKGALIFQKHVSALHRTCSNLTHLHSISLAADVAQSAKVANGVHSINRLNL